MGLNIAYQLRRRDPNLSVLILERAPALGFGSSGYSTGFQRAYYSFDETMRFALDGSPLTLMLYYYPNSLPSSSLP